MRLMHYERGTPVPSQLFPRGYRVTSPTRNRTTLGPYSRTMSGPTAVLGGGYFLMSEVPLYPAACPERSNDRTALLPYRGTSLIRKRPSLGPYRRAMPGPLWWS